MNHVSLGGRQFVPSKVICIGRNFPLHVKEMGGGAPSNEPVLFLKPNSAILFDSPKVFLPQEMGLIHHELELCFVVGRGGRGISPKRAEGAIVGFAVALDLTLRDRQGAAKKAGEPWALAKGFDGSAVLGPFADAETVGDVTDAVMELQVNDEIRQHGNTSEMIFCPEDILCFASRFMTIEPGDLFLCGTPAGVGPLVDGDLIQARIEGLPDLRIGVRR